MEEKGDSRRDHLTLQAINPSDYHSDGPKRSPYPGQVYLVFVNDGGVAYNWRWEKADPDDPNLPVDHQNRFRKRLL